MSNIPEGLSQADIDFLVANPGQTIGGAVGGASVRRPSASVDISNRQGKGLRPQIGGHVQGKERISGPSPGLAGRLAEGDAKLRAAAAAQKAEEEAHLHMADPTNLNNRISYLERQLKKLTTEVNKLKKAS